MSFKPNLQALHDCLHYMAASRTPKQTSPTKSESKRETFNRLTAEMHKKNAEDLFKKVPIKPSTAVGHRISQRNQNGSIIKIKERLNLMSNEAESFLNKTNKDPNDPTESNEKGKKSLSSLYVLIL